MIDVSRIVAEAVRQSKLVGCTCAVIVDVKVCPGGDVHPEHLLDVVRLHESNCHLMLRAWARWN